MNEKFVLIRKSNNQILNYNCDYPNIEIIPLIGMDSDLEYLIIREPYARPSVDERVINVNQVETMTSVQDTVYSFLRQYQITYTTSQKTNDEISALLDDLESSANQTTIPLSKQLKYTVLALEYLYVQLIDSGVLKGKEAKIVTKFRKQAKKVANNNDIKIAKNTILTSGTVPNLDTDWSINDFGAE